MNMGFAFTGYTLEYSTSSISPARLFKALELDFPRLLPNIMPQAISSVSIEGDGGPGSIRQFNFTPAANTKRLRERVDVVDEENFVSKYTLLLDGDDEIMGKLESITYDTKIQASSEGGSVVKSRAEYHGVLDAEFAEAHAKEGEEKSIRVIKTVEAYLLDNPHAYA